MEITYSNADVNISQAQLQTIAKLMKTATGINFHEGKQELLKSRLVKRLKQLHLNDFKEYLYYLKTSTDHDEYAVMVNILSTNVTEFFREPKHFEFLKTEIIKPKQAVNKLAARTLKVWSAGCSTGEEPYSIAMTILDSVDNIAIWDMKILATDISSRVLSNAKNALYHDKQVGHLPANSRLTYFDKVRHDQDVFWRVKEVVRRRINFGRLNLMAQWPMKGPFDVIFCRNVMIYFDLETQKHLINRFWEILSPNGILFIGHAESLIDCQNQFEYVKPTIYRKKS